MKKSASVLRVSVIIPHMNQPALLVRCLASLADQSFDMTDAEIVVVDNGSREMPEDICAQYGNVRLALEKEPGPGPARNKGISLTTAPLIAFIDADCLAEKDWLRTIVAAFDADAGLQVFGGDVRIAYEDPTNLTMLEAYESVYAYRQREYIEKLGFSGTGNLAMRRPVHEKVGPFAGISVAEDRDWGQRATSMGYTIHYLSGMIVFHPARKTMNELQKKWDRHIAHDYEEQAKGAVGKLKWLVKAAALLVSPVWEFGRILRSDRVSGLDSRLAALRVLTRIRLHRAKNMIIAPFMSNSVAKSQYWNRK